LGIFGVAAVMCTFTEEGKGRKDENVERGKGRRGKGRGKGVGKVEISSSILL